MKNKKLPYCNYKLLKNINNFYLGKIKIIKTWSRSSVILPRFIGLIIYTHNGKKHIPIKITESMIGYKLGEFSFTRTFNGHSKGKIVKKNGNNKIR